MMAAGVGWEHYRHARERYLRGLYPIEAVALAYRDWVVSQGHDEDHRVAMLKREIERLRCLWTPNPRKK